MVDTESSEAAPPARPSSALVARQPIFDAALNVVAYELLYRTEGEDRANVIDASGATADVVAGAMLDIGLNRLVGNAQAFINFPADLLRSPLQFPMAPERVVIELLEGARPDAALLQGLSRLRSEGFRVALDDFDLEHQSIELLAYADIVKVDVQQHSVEALVRCVGELRHHRVQLLAEKVESASEYMRCRDLGFDLYQGYFLQRPETFSGRRAPTSRLAALQLILSLDERHSSPDQVEIAVARDCGLSYRLLRCINSSYYSRPREVSSIRQAIVLLGYEELRRICSVALLTSIDDRPPYLATQALTRAKMCEALCVIAGQSGEEGYFMAGLLSMSDVLLGISIEDCLRQLPLDQPLRDALLDRQGPMGAALGCVLSYERGDWERIGFGNIGRVEIAAAYAQSVEWAEAVCASMRLVR